MIVLTKEIESEIAKQVDDMINVDVTEVKPDVVLETLQGYIPGIISFGINILICFAIYFVGKKIISVIRKIVRRSLERSSADKGVEQFVDSLLKSLLYLVLAMIIAGRLGIQTTSVVALVGSAGVAAGLALQGSLSNFAGGVLILILKPFKVGDYIVASGNEGVVKQIQIFYTKLLTIDNREILIPNGTLMNDNIINVTGQEKRRVDITVGISYSANIKEAKQRIEQVVSRETRILTEETTDVFVDHLGDSAVVIGLHAWTATENYWAVKWQLQEDIKLALEQAGIEIPFQQLSVHIEK